MSNRYSRQVKTIGPEAQGRLNSASVAVLGLGGTGSTIAEMLARAGVGRMVLMDRDRVEITNLQRQSLYTEKDAFDNEPKAYAALRALEKINSTLYGIGNKYDARFGEFSPDSAISSVFGMDLVIDGFDNFSSRMLLNEACLVTRTPWVYAAAEGFMSSSMLIRPWEGPCYVCAFPNNANLVVGDCDTTGVTAGAVHATAAWAFSAAIRQLCKGTPIFGEGETGENATLFYNTFAGGAPIHIPVTRNPDCPACGSGRSGTEHLNGRAWYESQERLMNRQRVRLSETGTWDLVKNDPR